MPMTAIDEERSEPRSRCPSSLSDLAAPSDTTGAGHRRDADRRSWAIEPQPACPAQPGGGARARAFYRQADDAPPSACGGHEARPANACGSRKDAACRPQCPLKWSTLPAQDAR